MKRIWRFDFKVSTDKLNKAYEQISNEDKDYLANVSIYGSFDIELKGKCQSYLIATTDNISVYREMFDKYKIKCKVVDITKDCISGKLDIQTDVIDFLGVRTDMSDYFIEEVEIIIYENLTMDGVLDKISKSGLKSLSRIEKQFMDDLSQTIE